LSVGIAAQNHFGLSLDWTSGWVGRYEAVNATVIAPQVQPTLALKVND
jgi:long-subunit fatty acid transport protein